MLAKDTAPLTATAVATLEPLPTRMYESVKSASFVKARPAEALISVFTIPVTVASSTRLCNLTLVTNSVEPKIYPFVKVAIGHHLLCREFL